MMEAIPRNHENRLQELQYNMIRSFDIGYARANTAQYPAKKPKLMIRDDNRNRSPLSYRLSTAEPKLWDNFQNVSGRYSPITPPPQPTENDSHKPIVNPYLPSSNAPQNLIKRTEEEEDDEGNLVIIEEDKDKNNRNEILNLKKSNSLLAYRKPQHRRNLPEFNTNTNSSTNQDTQSDEEIDVVSISPPKTNFEIFPNENRNLKRLTGCTSSAEKLYEQQPQIISRLNRDEITMGEEIELLKYLVSNKIRLNEREVLALRHRQLYYFNEIIENVHNKNGTRWADDVNMSLLKKDRMDIVPNDDFTIKIPKPAETITNNYTYTEKLNESEWYRRRTIEEINTMSKPYVRFSNEEYKVENWVASQHIKCSCHRDLLQSS